MFHWALQYQFHRFKKFQTSWLAKCCLVLLSRLPTSLYRSTVYVHTVIYQTMTPTPGSFNAYLYTCVLFAFIYSVRLNGCIFRGGGLWAPVSFMGGGGAIGPHLLNSRSNTE